MKRTLYVILLSVLVLALAGCDFSTQTPPITTTFTRTPTQTLTQTPSQTPTGTSTLTPTPTQSATSTTRPAYDEAAVRYELVLMQLDKQVGFYYRHSTALTDVETVRRWDEGVRVVNIDSFEAYCPPNPEGCESVLAVYKGTSKMINGMDVILTTD
jgi:hypothetical protein